MAFKFTKELQEKIEAAKSELKLEQVKMVQEALLVPAATEGVALGNALKKIVAEAKTHSNAAVDELGAEVGKAVEALFNVTKNHQGQLVALGSNINSTTIRVNNITEEVAKIDAKLDYLGISFNSTEFINITAVNVCGDSNSSNPCLEYVENK